MRFNGKSKNVTIFCVIFAIRNIRVISPYWEIRIQLFVSNIADGDKRSCQHHYQKNQLDDFFNHGYSSFFRYIDCCLSIKTIRLSTNEWKDRGLYVHGAQCDLPLGICPSWLCLKLCSSSDQNLLQIGSIVKIFSWKISRLIRDRLTIEGEW